MNSLGKLLIGLVAATLGIAACITPFAGIGGATVARVDATMKSNLADLTDGSAPGVTTITDANGEPIAWLYQQRRYEVEADQINQSVKDALVAIEDRRFYEHEGVDMQGFARAMVTNVLAGGVEEGASTIDQQYVKNYLLLVDAESTEQQTAAVEQSIPRKLREMRMASDLDKTLSKDEILTRYLNLVPFGNHAYGIEAAARVYFDSSAERLSVPQAALLVGMLQSAEMLNPYTNPDGATARRNDVLQAMVTSGYLSQADADRYKSEGLGVQDKPDRLPQGCFAAGGAGFLCDYAIKYLEGKGISRAELERGAYTIQTTLQPEVQAAAHNAVTSGVAPSTVGVAQVVNVVEPGDSTHNILAMTSSRDYGLSLEDNQTVLPQPASLMGNGAGSVFKIFTAAVALQNGYTLDSMLPVPTRSIKYNMGSGGAAGCPPGAYCVDNAGVYAPQMSLKDTLAQSPNTPFIELIEKVGVQQTVDMGVKLGLRSYEDKGSFDGEHSIADYFRDNNLGSFTLGPTPVNALELSNVAATLASGGRWCEPNPILKIEDRHGREVFLDREKCEDVLDEKVAASLASGMSLDAINGTAKDAAAGAGWRSPVAAKTGTTESHQSSAFLGFNSKFAAATYIFNDGTQTTPLCTGPVRQCPYGNLFGGNEAAGSWFRLANQLPGVPEAGLPAASPLFDEGSRNAFFDQVTGMDAAAARSMLEGAGFTVIEVTGPGNGAPAGQVISARASGTVPGQQPTVTITVSDGSRGSGWGNWGRTDDTNPDDNGGGWGFNNPPITRDEFERRLDNFGQQLDLW
nr:transglycosylase domain-containing protein [Corynebacterium aquatimens]